MPLGGLVRAALAEAHKRLSERGCLPLPRLVPVWDQVGHHGKLRPLVLLSPGLVAWRGGGGAGDVVGAGRFRSRWRLHCVDEVVLHLGAD
jgi:hypothetical protein